MSLFTSSFRALLAAVLVIVCLEAATYAIKRPNFVERSNYLDFNYLSSETLHKAIIYEKLRLFATVAPDVVQVGDSSGMENVVPELVQQYLGGLSYVNLSCCANTGFDGYYAIAKAVLERSQKTKALVLYITFNNLPALNRNNGDATVGGGTRIRDTFTSPWAVFWPPSMSLRSEVTAAVYSMGGAIRPQIDALNHSSLSVFVRGWIAKHAGWVPEGDPRFVPTNSKSVLTTLCGGDSTLGISFDPDIPNSRFYAKRMFGKEFYPAAVFRGFADLAAASGAKLVIAFHPHPCGSIRPGELRILADALSALVRERPNVIVIPDAIFEPWPIAMFTSPDHLRAGYEGANSLRLGRLLATALGRPEREATPNPRDPSAERDADASSPNVWSQSENGWSIFGARSRGPNDREQTIELVEEQGGRGFWVHATIPKIEPRKRYVFSVTVKPNGPNAINFGIRDSKTPGQDGHATCDFKAGVGFRTSFMAFDTDIEPLHEGWWRCWVSILICDTTAVVDLTVRGDQQAPTTSAERGLLVREARVQNGWRRMRENASPLPAIIPVGQRCP